MKKRLKSCAGETLVETLASVLIVVLAFVILATASVTAAKINAKVRTTDNSFRYATETPDGEKAGEKAKVTLIELIEEGSTAKTNGTSREVILYTSGNGYVYYTAGETP